MSLYIVIFEERVPDVVNQMRDNSGISTWMKVNEQAILEVIACSVADAIEAQKGGASRLEVVRDLDRGGLTPPIELVRAIKEAVDLPLRVMVRESDGFGTSDEFELKDFVMQRRSSQAWVLMVL